MIRCFESSEGIDLLWLLHLLSFWSYAERIFKIESNQTKNISHSFKFLDRCSAPIRSTVQYSHTLITNKNMFSEKPHLESSKIWLKSQLLTKNIYHSHQYNVDALTMLWTFARMRYIYLGYYTYKIGSLSWLIWFFLSSNWWTRSLQAIMEIYRLLTITTIRQTNIKIIRALDANMWNLLCCVITSSSNTKQLYAIKFSSNRAHDSKFDKHIW